MQSITPTKLYVTFTILSATHVVSQILQVEICQPACQHYKTKLDKFVNAQNQPRPCRCGAFTLMNHIFK